MAGLLFMLASS